eukprot:COSAG01_NODE_1032_length_12010_cov_10.208494_6_plen_431_part_00
MLLRSLAHRSFSQPLRSTGTGSCWQCHYCLAGCLLLYIVAGDFPQVRGGVQDPGAAHAMLTKEEVRAYMTGLTKAEHDGLLVEIAASRWIAAGKTALLAAANCQPASPPAPSDSRRQTPRTKQQNLLLHTPDAVLLRIVSFVGTTADLARLGAVCQRFRTKSVVSPVPSDASLLAWLLGPVLDAGSSVDLPDVWSVVQEAARLRLMGFSEIQRAWVPRRGGESFVGLLHELEGQCAPKEFTLGGPHVQFIPPNVFPAYPNGKAAVVGVVDGEHFESAVCGCAMRAGRHWAEMVVEFEYPLFGVVSSSFDPTADGDGSEAGTSQGHGAMLEIDGIAAVGDRVGALLDLDAGSLRFYKYALVGGGAWRLIEGHATRGDLMPQGSTNGGIYFLRSNVGSLRWAVDLGDDGTATITGGAPPAATTRPRGLLYVE